MRHILTLSARNLLRQRRRALLALTIVAGGVVAFLLASGFINWIFQDMREATIHSQLGHVQVTRPGYLREGLGDPYQYLLPADTSPVTGIIGQQARTVTPRLAFSGLLSKDEATVSFVGEGISPEQEQPIARAITIVAGKDLTESPPDSVLLGEGLAANLDASPGDRVVLLATTASGGINAVELTVAGLFATITKAYDDTVLRAPIDVARKLMRVEGATSWVVLLNETSDTDKAVHALRERLPATGFEVIPWTDLADFYNKTVELFSRQVGVVQLLIALIVILSISNTLSMTVVERTGEIGTSMALGVRRHEILKLFVTEGILLGIISGVVGIMLGYLLAQVISAIGIPMPPPPGMARGYTGEIAISPALALEAFALAFFTTLLASLFPAWKASRMNIVDALRHQR
ncbi:ABC transporter permease [Thauera sp. Sel9]|uniref:ABC transporter permease n=1 Tax=Thauera sp. Sel9 TaxID=2974299 RepID=UPI0021E109E1|nr:FtsX-like permease family protein [Thauera sp. Sel9]MCV2218914.1 FtsX-like permease family protein [Thauera sp. Sel9]